MARSNTEIAGSRSCLFLLLLHLVGDVHGGFLDVGKLLLIIMIKRYSMIIIKTNLEHGTIFTSGYKDNWKAVNKEGRQQWHRCK